MFTRWEDNLTLLGALLTVAFPRFPLSLSVGELQAMIGCPIFGLSGESKEEIGWPITSKSTDKK